MAILVGLLLAQALTCAVSAGAVMFAVATTPDADVLLLVAAPALTALALLCFAAAVLLFERWVV